MTQRIPLKIQPSLLQINPQHQTQPFLHPTHKVSHKAKPSPPLPPPHTHTPNHLHTYTPPSPLLQTLPEPESAGPLEPLEAGIRLSVAAEAGTRLAVAEAEAGTRLSEAEAEAGGQGGGRPAQRGGQEKAGPLPLAAGGG